MVAWNNTFVLFQINIFSMCFYLLHYDGNVSIPQYKKKTYDIVLRMLATLLTRGITLTSYISSRISLIGVCRLLDWATLFPVWYVARSMPWNIASPTPCILMFWLLASPCHQQPQPMCGKIVNGSLSSVRKYMKRCQFRSDLFKKVEIKFHIFAINSS